MIAPITIRYPDFPDLEAGPVRALYFEARRQILDVGIPTLESMVIKPFENALKNHVRTKAHRSEGVDENGVLARSKSMRIPLEPFLLEVQAQRRTAASYGSALKDLRTVLSYEERAADRSGEDSMRYRHLVFVRAHEVARELDSLVDQRSASEKFNVRWLDHAGRSRALDERIEHVTFMPEPRSAAHLTSGNARLVFEAKHLVERLKGFATIVHDQAIEHYVTAFDHERAQALDVLIPMERPWYLALKPVPKTSVSYKPIVTTLASDLDVLSHVDLEHETDAIASQRMRTPGHGTIKIRDAKGARSYRVIERDGTLAVRTQSVLDAIGTLTQAHTTRGVRIEDRFIPLRQYA